MCTVFAYVSISTRIFVFMLAACSFFSGFFCAVANGGRITGPHVGVSVFSAFLRC